MKILAVDHCVPSRRVTNADILAELRARSSAHLSARDCELLEATVLRFLERAQTEVRYILAPTERAIDLALTAARRAMTTADVDASDVDLVIFAGIARGWLDPAMANVVQSGLGLRNATCFDVVDGCASWIRAMHVAQQFMETGTYLTGLVVNCEAGLTNYADFEVRHLDDLEPRLAAFTIGEAASATVVTAEGSPWHFKFRNFSDPYDVCLLPLDTYEQFTLAATDSRYTPGRFYSRSRELIPAVVRRIVEVFESDATFREGTYDIVLGHAASERASAIVLKRLGIEYDRYFPTHSRFGNTVSAATPLAISLAIQEGRLRRGDRVLVIVGSAGIAIGLATFRF